MNPDPTNEQEITIGEVYTPPVLVELDAMSEVTLGKYAEDSADKGRYFE
jgi:hypothetical protein